MLSRSSLFAPTSTLLSASEAIRQADELARYALDHLADEPHHKAVEGHLTAMCTQATATVAALNLPL